MQPGEHSREAGDGRGRARVAPTPTSGMGFKSPLGSVARNVSVNSSLMRPRSGAISRSWQTQSTRCVTRHSTPPPATARGAHLGEQRLPVLVRHHVVVQELQRGAQS